jgi:nitrous oxidase accessory protein NosD
MARTVGEAVVVGTVACSDDVRWASVRRPRVAVACLLVVLLIGLVDAGRAQARATAAVLQVCPTGATYTTIQAAITAATAGDRIEVCAGTFTEQLTVTKSVTIAGAGSGQTTIQAPSPLVASQDIVTVSGAGVVVDLGGVTIKGPGPTNDCSGLLSGVFVRDGAHASIHDDLITAIRNNPIDGCQKGVGVRVGRAALSTSGTAAISGTTISGYQKGGIVVDGPGSGATITGNTITGAGPTDAVAQNGIQVSRAATATVTGNTISGNAYTRAGGATGILLYSNLGAVTVSGNTFQDDDLGISVLNVSGGPVSVKSNKVSGGDRGITLEATQGTLVEQNTVTGAATFGVFADGDSAGNTFRGNAAGSSAALYDCRDLSSGDKTAGSANTWTDNTGATAAPDAICLPKTEPPTPAQPPLEVDSPPVIVLPPVESGNGTPAPAPPVVQPPSGGGSAKADEIVTKMRDNGMKSCVITVTTRGKHEVQLARGLARAPAGRRGVLIVRLGVRPKGEQLLSKQFGGVIVDVQAVCRTARNGTAHGVKTARVVLAVERVTTSPGSWQPDRAVLTNVGHQFLARLRKRMIALKGLRCDGYTATWTPSPANPLTLSQARARVACHEVMRGATVQPTLVPHGRSDPIASNATEAGRAVNRRVTITFVHQLRTRKLGR